MTWTYDELDEVLEDHFKSSLTEEDKLYRDCGEMHCLFKMYCYDLFAREVLRGRTAEFAISAVLANMPGELNDARALATDEREKQ